MAPHRSPALAQISRDLRDIQHTLDQMVHQLAPYRMRPPDPRATRSLLAAISYKLAHLQAALHA